MTLHHIFLCAEEVADTIPIHQAVLPTIVHVNVPGYIKKKNRQGVPHTVKVSKVQKLLSEEARVNADAAVRWGLLLHQSGKSLKGKFKVEDLRKDICDSVKCAATKKSSAEEKPLPRENLKISRG